MSHVQLVCPAWPAGRAGRVDQRQAQRCRALSPDALRSRQGPRHARHGRDSDAGPSPAAFLLPSEADAAAAWLSRYFGEAVELRHFPGGFPDDTNAPGPTIISTGSLEAVCAWFPHLTLASARERFRANLEIAGVPAFWEDELFAAEADTLIRLRIGEVLVEGLNPCARCVVPSRDPLTGDVFVGFQGQFAQARRAHLPPWAPAARFDHYYRLAINTRIPATEAGKILRVGDPLTLL